MNLQLISENGTLTQQGINALTQSGIIPANTPEAQIIVFAKICQEQGLSPFSKEIYLVEYRGKYTPITGINGLRKRAIDTGLLAGVSAPMFDMQADGKYKTMADFKAGQKPTTCTVIVYKVVAGLRCPFEATVMFNEFAGQFNKWVSMPFQMIAKVAESHALRKAFAITGVFIEEELDAIHDTVQSTPRVPKPVFDPTHEGWEKALEGLNAGKFSVSKILEKYEVSETDLATLQTAENEQA